VEKRSNFKSKKTILILISKYGLFNFGEIEQIKNEVNKCKVSKKRKTTLIPMSNHTFFLASGKSSGINF